MAVNNQESKYTRARRLLLAYNFPLNKSFTKHVTVGLNWLADGVFEPVVQLTGTNSRGNLSIPLHDWVDLYGSLDHIVRYFEEDDTQPDFHYRYFTREYDTVMVNFEYIHNRRTAIFDYVGGGGENKILLQAVSIAELKNKAIWINQWLHILKKIDRPLYQKVFVDVIADDVFHQLMNESGDVSCIPSATDIEKYVMDNFNNVFDGCEKYLYNCTPKQNHPYLFMFFGELINFHFDITSGLILKQLNDICHKSTASTVNKNQQFYGFK